MLMLVPPSSTAAQPSNYTQVMAPSDPLRFHHKTDMTMTVTRASMYCSLGPMICNSFMDLNLNYSESTLH
jgi:hypothetical protein